MCHSIVSLNSVTQFSQSFLSFSPFSHSVVSSLLSVIFSEFRKAAATKVVYKIEDETVELKSIIFKACFQILFDKQMTNLLRGGRED